MTAAVAGTGVRHLVHFSSREILEWGKIPKQSEYNNSLAISRHRTAFRTGKPSGLWYAYADDWEKHHKPTANKKLNAFVIESRKDKFDYKYEFPVPESRFTSSLEPNSEKILLLTPDNFQEFLQQFGAPGVRSKRKTWVDFWQGYTFEKTGEHVKGVQDKFAGVDFSQELVDFAPEGMKLRFSFDDHGATKTADVDVSFLKYLEIRSGCIFHPEILFPEGPVPYLTGRPTAGAASATATGTARRGGRRSRRRSRLTAPRTLCVLRRKGL